MKYSPEDIDALIASYLSGEATPEEIQFVEEWKDQNEQNRRYFEQFTLIFEKAARPASVQFDTDRAWEKLRAKLPDKDRSHAIPLKPHQGSLHLLLRIAAGIVILVAAGIFTYRFFNGNSARPIHFASGDVMKSDTLPDGTAVFLNRGTRIEYSFTGRHELHTAKLAGEAYFNIHPDPEKTFIVEAEGTFIKDIGTSFNIKAYPDSSAIEVFVEEGEVMFYTEDNPGLHLAAGTSGIYDKKTRTFSRIAPKPNVTAYKTKSFKFADQTLRRVVQTLNEVYNRKILVDEGLESCRITVAFHDEDPLEIANIIAETLGATVSTSNDVIKLEGPGCGEAQEK